ncbi:unnamed protein product [Meganyctiphanes norvegica]|uniref:Uncharacterized protein n=1 Tax=Meganyctiphanes norvegica TaxID=48144 RepID=A0AAV2S3V4_MEGNR
MKPDKTFKGKYEEIVIIGDERIPKLRVYKNVKIYRGPGLQLKDVVSFVKKCGLHHDKVNSKVIILCVGLNDLIETVHAKDCLFVSKKDCKSHTPCYLFRYKSITHDLIGEMMRQVDKMYLFLPSSYKVTFSCLHLFDLNTLNHNLSQEHYLKFGHDAKLSESDIHNNKKIHSLIKKVNTSLRNEKAGYIDLLRIDEFVMKKYQVNDDINFTDNTQKLMVNNIKIIQSLYSKSHGDESSSHDKEKRNSIIHPKESDIDKTDLRWMLNRRKKDDVLNPRSNRNLKIDKREVLDSEIRRELQTDKRLGAHTNFSDLKGSPLVWHSPGRCISPPGWHLQEVCRKKEEERRDKYKKEKMERTKTGNSEKSISARRESSEINMEKTERNRMERKYKKENMKRTKTEKSERSISARRESSEINMEKVERNRMEREGRIYGKISSTSRISESISTKSSNEGSAKTQIPEKYEHFERHSQKSRSSSRTVEKELDIALCNLREVHDRSCRMYNENPAAHPDYYKEYHLFYQVKSKKIIEIGGNPYEYDFLPEWQSFWQARSKEIFREAWLNMKNQCMQMIEEKKFTQGKHMHEERRVQEDRSRRSESITKGKIMHEERKVQEDRSHRSESVSSSSSSRSSSRSSRSTHRNKRRRSSDSGRPNYKKGKKRSEKRDLSPPIKKKHKYDVKEDSKSSNNEGDFISMKNKLQLVKELKEMNKPGDTNEFVEFSSINNEMLKQILESSKKSSLDFGKNQKNHLPSVNEERWLDDLGLEEVGESVIPFNLGKYVPEKKVNKEEITIGNSNLTDNVLEVLMMLSQLGDKMGSLVIPIKALFDKANQQNMMNRSTIDIFTDPDASILLQLVSSKLQIAINNENIDVIEKVISQELKNRVDKLIKTVEETFVEGVNVEYVAEKSLGMGSSEIVDIIKSVLEISTSSSFSAEKMMKIYKAVKEKQFRYIETTSNSNECSNSLEMAFSMQAPETNNINKVKLSPTEIPFNLPTRKKIDTSEKYDPFEQE